MGHEAVPDFRELHARAASLLTQLRIAFSNALGVRLFTPSACSLLAGIDHDLAKLIKYERIPKSFLNTSLTQIWKKKGSALDLNNMRFIHMRHWHSKLMEALITEKNE